MATAMFFETLGDFNIRRGSHRKSELYTELQLPKLEDKNEKRLSIQLYIV
jgi:hypothetical protein